jgi:hypothetical protein
MVARRAGVFERADESADSGAGARQGFLVARKVQIGSQSREHAKDAKQSQRKRFVKSSHH